MGLSHYLVTTC